MFSTYTTMKKTLLPLLLITLLLANVPHAALAQGSAPVGVVMTSSPDGVQITWTAQDVGMASAETARGLLPLARYNGYDLPLQSVTLTILPGATPAVVIEQMASTPLVGGIEPGAPVMPPVLDWTPMPNVLPTEEAHLPAAPAFILREGVVRGQRFAVLAISPIYEEAGVVKLATALHVSVPGAILSTTALGEMATASAQFAPAQPEVVDVPINQAALLDGFKIVVSRPGLQEVMFSALSAGFDASKVNLTHRGEAVAVEVLGDRFRFYAPVVGDRWNMTSVYWLTSDASGKRMAEGDNAGAAAPTGQATEHGIWRENKVYVSEYAGVDEDRWFNTSLTVLGTATSNFPSVTIPIASHLPSAAGQATFTTAITVIGKAPTSNDECLANPPVLPYKMQAEMLHGNGVVLETQRQEWSPYTNVSNVCKVKDDWQLTWTTGVMPASLRLTLLPSGVAGYDTSILLDTVEWERPVDLNFDGNGAEFGTQPGAWSIALAGLPALRALYDVTDPLNPVKVPLDAGSQVVFGQPDSTAPRHYLLARLDAPITPAVSAHSAVNFGNVLEKEAIYIGPAQWNNALQPLLTLRTAQGHNPLFVDVQAIFDVYGYGYVSAPTIRNFLRHRTDWQNLSRAISVVLVGDGTYDPYNFRNTGFGSGLIHPIPPYMLDVDIYINEAPCETCFAQLNGDDPVTGDDPNARNPKSNVFAPDVWIGRFPVRNETELTAMVKKIVAYEQGPGLAGWGSTQLLLADNYIVSINDQNQVTLDPGGDFAFYSDEVVALAGYGANAKRVYYDHSPDRKVLLEKSGIVAGRFDTVERHPPEPWRFPSVNEARQKSVEAINAGAGLMFYNGHSNHWQYAKLEDRSGVAVSPLFSTIEANALANGGKLFIGLSMTCLTSQFAIPAVSGTLDELFVRNPSGGAVATWGPTGLSVAHGHDYLQKGFVSKLRYSPVGSQRLGDLVEAGYNSLLTSPLTNSLDALKTFAVLGDPLTRVRANVGFDNGIFLPTVQR